MKQILMCILLFGILVNSVPFTSDFNFVREINADAHFVCADSNFCCELGGNVCYNGTTAISTTGWDNKAWRVTGVMASSIGYNVVISTVEGHANIIYLNQSLQKFASKQYIDTQLTAGSESETYGKSRMHQYEDTGAIGYIGYGYNGVNFIRTGFYIGTIENGNFTAGRGYNISQAITAKRANYNDADFGIIGDDLAIMIYDDQDDLFRFYLENAAHTQIENILNITFADVVTDTVFPIQCAGSEHSFICLMSDSTGDIYRFKWNCDIYGTTRTCGGTTNFSKIGDTWFEYSCAEGTEPLCAFTSSIEAEKNYVWLMLFKSGLSYDISAFNAGERLDRLNINHNQTDYFISGTGAANKGEIYQGTSADFLIKYPITIYAKTSDGYFASSSNVKCEEYGQVCLVKGNQTTPVNIYNNYFSSPSDSVFPGEYSVQYTDIWGDTITCDNNIFVSSYGNNYYTIYTDGINCNSAGSSSGGIAVRAYGAYGATHVNASSVAMYARPYYSNTQTDANIECQWNGLNASVVYRYGLENQNGALYTRSFALDGESEGNLTANLTCDGYAGYVTTHSVVYDVTPDVSWTEGSISILSQKLVSLRKNVVKIKFLDDSLGEVTDGVCYLNYSGGTYPMYYTYPEYCSLISGIGGDDCLSDSYYYSVIDLTQQLVLENTTIPANIICYSSEFNASSQLNFTIQNTSLHSTYIKWYDYLMAQKGLGDYIYFVNDTNQDVFRFAGFSQFSDSVVTPAIFSNQQCTLAYETCDMISATEWITNTNIVPLEMAPLPEGLGYVTDWLSTVNLCNGRINGMPTHGWVRFNCTSSDETFRPTYGTYYANTDFSKASTISGLIILGPDLSNFFNAIFQTIYYMVGILAQIAIAHMLETVILVTVIVLIMPLIRRQ